MSQTSIEAGNRLIAEFMCYYKIHDTSFLTDDRSELWLKSRDGDIIQGCPKYHEDWNLLMPVVEKIESLGYDTDIALMTSRTNGVEERKNICAIQNKWNDAAVCYIEAETKIEATWQAITQFIEWFNKEKGVQGSDTSKDASNSSAK